MNEPAPRRHAPAGASPDVLAAVRAEARRRRARVGLALGSAAATAVVVGGVALATSEGDRPARTLVAPPSPTDGMAWLQAYRRAEDDCLRSKGVTITEQGSGEVRAFKPAHPDDANLDDLMYACQLQLRDQGWHVIPRSPEPGPDITQVLEVRFKPGTYDASLQSRVSACYQRDGVTPLPSTAPSPPSQRFRFHGDNVDEGKVIFDCLSVIPGVVVVDVPTPSP